MVARNTNTPTDTLNSLTLSDYFSDDDMLKTIAKNVNTSSDTLLSLVHHTQHAFVRLIAASSPVSNELKQWVSIGMFHKLDMNSVLALSRY